MPLDLSQMKQLEAKATKGPLYASPLEEIRHIDDMHGSPLFAIQRSHTEDGGFAEVLRARIRYDDARFFCHARTWIPDAIAEIEAARGEIVNGCHMPTLRYIVGKLRVDAAFAHPQGGNEQGLGRALRMVEGMIERRLALEPRT